MKLYHYQRTSGAVRVGYMLPSSRLGLDLIVFLVQHQHDDGLGAGHSRTVSYADPLEFRRIFQSFGSDKGHGGLLAVGKIESQSLVANRVRAAEVSARIRYTSITMGVGDPNHLIRQTVVKERAIGKELNVSFIRGGRPMILSGKLFSRAAAGGDIRVNAGTGGGFAVLDDVAAIGVVGPDDVYLVPIDPVAADK